MYLFNRETFESHNWISLRSILTSLIFWLCPRLTFMEDLLASTFLTCSYSLGIQLCITHWNACRIDSPDASTLWTADQNTTIDLLYRERKTLDNGQYRNRLTKRSAAMSNKYRRCTSERSTHSVNSSDSRDQNSNLVCIELSTSDRLGISDRPWWIKLSVNLPINCVAYSLATTQNTLYSLFEKRHLLAPPLAAGVLLATVTRTKFPWYQQDLDIS